MLYTLKGIQHIFSAGNEKGFLKIQRFDSENQNHGLPERRQALLKAPEGVSGRGRVEDDPDCPQHPGRATKGILGLNRPHPRLHTSRDALGRRIKANSRITSSPGPVEKT